MFGVGFLRNGNLCLGAWKGALIVRLGPEQADEALREPHISEFNVRGRPMKGRVLVAAQPFRGDQVGTWVQRALPFTGSLPAKVTWGTWPRRTGLG